MSTLRWKSGSVFGIAGYSMQNSISEAGKNHNYFCNLIKLHIDKRIVLVYYNICNLAKLQKEGSYGIKKLR